jgi:hypothetical protein
LDDNSLGDPVSDSAGGAVNRWIGRPHLRLMSLIGVAWPQTSNQVTHIRLAMPRLVDALVSPRGIGRLLWGMKSSFLPLIGTSSAGRLIGQMAAPRREIS